MIIVHHLISTVKPLIKGQPGSLRRTLPISPIVYNYVIHFQLPKIGQPPYKGQNGWSQSVLYLEFSTVHH